MGIDFDEMKSRATRWMMGRGWKTKLAKRKGFEQSLFEHTFCELDALVTLFSIWMEYDAYNGLTLEEQKILFVTALLHDLGKETDAWQEYILGNGQGYVSHCDEALLKKTLPELVSLFDITGIGEIVSGVLLHMRSASTAGNIFAHTALGVHSNPRWKMLADLVAEVDNFCSAKGLFGGLAALERSDFMKTLSVEYHQINICGISTTMLHRATLDCFIEKGWKPLMHYANGTIYAASPLGGLVAPTREEIRLRLTKIVDEVLMGRDFSQQVVGSPVASMLPKADLFDYREMRSYLEAAAGRVKRTGFRKKKTAVQQKVVTEYLQISKIADSKREWEYHAERIGEAHPEMVIFKFFKTALSEKLIDPASLRVDSETDIALKKTCRPETPEGEKRYQKAIRKEKQRIWDGFQDVLCQEYERVFGPGSFSGLISTSTLMAARDMAMTIDYFWQLPASRFNKQAVPDQVAFLKPEDREKLLIELLCRIADKAFSALNDENRPTRISPGTFAAHFMSDLIHPPAVISFKKIATNQMEAYSRSKPFAKKEKGEHLCPQCNQPFTGGSTARSDFLNKPESHTNRAAAHCAPGLIVICDRCRYERFLEQLVLGRKPATTLALFPRMGVSPGAGAILKKKAEDIWAMLSLFMSDRTPDSTTKVSLGLTGEIARKLGTRDAWSLSPEEVSDLLTYRTSKETEKKRRKTLEGLLWDNIGPDVDALNTLWMTDYPTWDEAVDALIRGEVKEPESLRYRSEALLLTPSLTIICQTPHMILIPNQNPIAVGDESDVNAGLRELFILMILGLSLDCTAASFGDEEAICFEGGEGVARVPHVPALHRLIGGEWVSLQDSGKWIRAIAAASQLSVAADYPERSNLYMMLTAPTEGHILRRIEQKSASGIASICHLKHIEDIKYVLE